MMIVAADGSGDFRTVQEAIDAADAYGSGQPVTIRIRSGIYKEKVSVERPGVTLIGDDAESTIITYDDYAQKQFPDGEHYHTFHSYSFLVGADDFTAEQLTFANTAGPGERVGQALAVYADGDRTVFRRCRFLGKQDTLFTGPLPPKPKERASFGGPRDILPRRATRQLYEDCYIEGDIDFIFGSATAYFLGCELFSRRRDLPGVGEAHPVTHGWITAASTPEHAPFGYVFDTCRLTGDAPPGSVYLGRPWRDHAHTLYMNCWMGTHIRPEGWDNWGRPDSEHSVRYEEYANTGPGACPSQRVSWSRQLLPEEAEHYRIGRVLAGHDGWNPV
ncbi:pectinesterase family protein [Paenibacillus tarimensis]|uniref:pectinesterase family protein n=1 Tax=Paenibacillus tarimensis TaxID=416012 RepID=UPI001F290062|nr:pectinesterase family protein [Paenibacillus tarimensis]MCF2944061.1 pectinesterase family protein [Paenibacillus tarimensis]